MGLWEEDNIKKKISQPMPLLLMMDLTFRTNLTNIPKLEGKYETKTS